MMSIAAKIGCTAETLRGWVRQSERDQGRCAGATTEERERIRALEREVRELRQANEILRKASAYFAQAELARRFKPSTRRGDPIPQEAGASGTGRDRLHRHAPRHLRGRADLQAAADRPVDVPRARGAACRSLEAAGPRQARRRAARPHPAGLERALPGLWGEEGLAAAAPRGDRGGPLHGGATDAGDGAARGHSWQHGADHDPGQGRTLPARSGQPGLQGAAADRPSAI